MMALWAIRAGLAPAPDDAPLWVRVGCTEARRRLSRMLDAVAP